MTLSPTGNIQTLLSGSLIKTNSTTTFSSSNENTRYTPVSVPYNIIQTFFTDPEAVGGASQIYLTSIDLFVRTKPKTTLNTSGSTSPGIVVSICDVTDNNPDPTKIVEGSMVRLDYSRIYAFSDASVPTTFTFAKPIPVLSNRFYGIMVSFEDGGYQCWVNKTGDRLVGTNTPSAGSNNTKDGKYYVTTNTDRFTAINDTDLKYRVKAAKYQANTATINLVNKHYEFLTVNTRRGLFLGGEYVYQNSANATGTISVSQGNTSIVGTNTNFTTLSEGNLIVLVSNTTIQVVEIDSVTNSTFLTTNTVPNFTNSAAVYMIAPIGKVFYSDYVKDKLYLVESNANTTVKFSAAGSILAPLSGANAIITSIDVRQADRIVPKLALSASANSSINLTYALAANVANSSVIQTADNLALNRINEIKKYAGRVISRSLEVDQAGLHGNKRKSLVITMDVNVDSTGNNLHETAAVNTAETDVFVQQNIINNTYANNTNDTEVYKNGLALSKGFTKKFAFANNRFAEDLRVYMNAYRPQNTDLRVYAKLHNSQDPETFDDKLWTPLTAIQNANAYSSSTDINDLVEIEFALPQYPVSSQTLPGSFTTVLANTVITGNGVSPNTYVSANSLIKLYNPLIPNNYMVVPVTAANSTTITLGTAVANNNLVGSGFVVDVMRDKGTAFVNALNGNRATYFTLTLNEVATFDSMQFKIVFLAANSNLVPEVDDFRAIGVNAGT